MFDRQIEWPSRRPPCVRLLFWPSVSPFHIFPSDSLFTLVSSSALTDAALSRLTNKLIVSIVYSNDVVARLSLGSIRDLKNAAMWLCEANEAGDRSEGWSAITAHAKRWKEGSGSKDDMNWVRFISLYMANKRTKRPFA